MAESADTLAMAKELRTALLQSIQLMLLPIVRYCLRHNVKIQELIELVRVAFVKAAADEMVASGEKVNISRISVASGLQRKAVERIHREGEVKQAESRLDKIIGQWRYDRRFCSKQGRPKVLECDYDSSDFSRLVRSVNKELHPASVLFELERLGAVERTANGVRLKTLAFEPNQSSVDGMKLLARDVDDLISAVTTNIESSQSDNLPNFHAASIFDNVNESDLGKIRSWLLKSCSAFHTRVEKFLATKDLDLSPKKGASGGKRVVFTSFSRTE